MKELMKGLSFIANKLIKRFYDYSQKTKNQESASLCLSAAMSIIILEMILKSSFKKTLIMFILFCIISGFVLNYEIVIKRTLNNLKIPSKIKKGILNKILDYNSKFFNDKLFYAFPFAIFYMRLCNNCHYNTLQALQHFNKVLSNFNFGDALLFGSCAIFALMRKHICFFIEDIIKAIIRISINYENCRKHIKNNLKKYVKERLIIIFIFLYFPLLFASLVAMFIEVKSNLIYSVAFGILFLGLVEGLLALLLFYVYDHSSYSLKK